MDLFPQCKISIGNNSGSIKIESWSLRIYHGVFGNCGSNGVTAIFVTWPEVTTPTDSATIVVKTPWMRVTPVTYMLKQSIMGQKMCFGITSINLAVWMKNSIFSTIFRNKEAKFPILTMKNLLIGNNFGRIEDRAVRFAYNRRFRPWRIQWCDRHLCHVTSDDAYTKSS